MTGGEERAVGDIAALLARRGHDVAVLERSSASAGRGRSAVGMLAGGLDPGEIHRIVRTRRADVVHVHNVHPLFGWRALAAARAAGARTVLHLHNFRLFCAIGVAYRDAGPCFRCRGGNTLPGLRLRCRGSFSEAVVYAAALHRQQPQLYRHVDRFVAVSRAAAQRLYELGLPPERTATLSNFVPDSSFVSDSSAATGAFALTSGRLVEEKGFDTAIAAARAAEVPLVIAGTGPDEARLRALAAGGQVHFTGFLQEDALAELRARAAIVLVPSRCEEGCPYAVLDALASGVPVLASYRGGLPELVGRDGVLPADDQMAWADALAELWRDPALRLARGRDAIARSRERFGEDRYYDALMGVYEDVRNRGLTQAISN